MCVRPGSLSARALPWACRCNPINRGSVIDLLPLPWVRQDRYIDGVPEMGDLSVIGVMFSDTAADGDARPTSAL